MTAAELIGRLRDVQLSPRARRLVTWIGYPAFALAVALTTLSMSVSSERVKERLESALSADPLSGQPMAIGMDVSIGSLSLSLLTGIGVNANDVVLRTRPINPGDKPVRILIDEVRVRAGLFGLLFNRPTWSFRAQLFHGEVEGKVATSLDDTHVQAEVKKLLLNGSSVIQQWLGLPAEGTLSGKIDVDTPKNLVANANGSIEIDLENGAFGDGKAKFKLPGSTDPFLSQGITLPRIALGHLSGRTNIDKGKARFQDLRVHSSDGDATLEGSVDLRDPIAMSTIRAYFKFKLNDAVVKREPMLELARGALGPTALRDDGFYGIQLNGPLASMIPLPSKEPPFGLNGGGPGADRPSPGALQGNRPLAPGLANRPTLPRPSGFPSVPGGASPITPGSGGVAEPTGTEAPPPATRDVVAPPPLPSVAAPPGVRLQPGARPTPNEPARAGDEAGNNNNETP